jgi:hypothetical protein
MLNAVIALAASAPEDLMRKSRRPSRLAPRLLLDFLI